MEHYTHTVQYYETDRMGITHHSNYVRWMEEARIDFLRRIGWDYDRLERLGIFSPVTAVECRYKAPTTFPEPVEIAVSVAEFRGVRLRLRYVMRRPTGETVCEAASEHCFTDREGRILRLRKEHPELHRVLTELAESPGEVG